MDNSKSSAHLYTSQQIQQSPYRRELAWGPPPPHQGTFPPAAMRSPQNYSTYRFPAPRNHAPFDLSMYRVDPGALSAKGIIPEPLLMRQMLEVRHRMIRMRFRNPHAVFVAEENHCEAFMRSTCSDSSGKELEKKYHRDVQRLLDDGQDPSHQPFGQHPAHYQGRSYLTPKEIRNQPKVDKRIAKQQVKEIKESAKMQKAIVKQQVKAMNDSARIQKEMGKHVAKEMKDSAKVLKATNKREAGELKQASKKLKESGKQQAKDLKRSASSPTVPKQQADKMKEVAKVQKEVTKQQAAVIKDTAKVIEKEGKQQAKNMKKAAKLELKIGKEQSKDIKETAKVQKEAGKQLVKEINESAKLHDETTKQQIKEKKEASKIQAEIAKQPSKPDLITHYSEAEAQQPAPSTNNRMVMNRGYVEVANSVNSQRITTTTADSLYSSQPTYASTFKDNFDETFSNSSLALIYPPKLNRSVSLRNNQKSSPGLSTEGVSKTTSQTEMQERCKTNALSLINSPALTFGNETERLSALKNKTSKTLQGNSQTVLSDETETRSTGDFSCGQQVKECGSKGESNETSLKSEPSPSNGLSKFFKSPMLDSQTINKPKKYESSNNKSSKVGKTSITKDFENFLFKINEDDKKQKLQGVQINKAKVGESQSFEKQDEPYDKVFENDLLKSIGSFVVLLKGQSECKTRSDSIDNKGNVKKELVKKTETSKKFLSSAFVNEKSVPSPTEEPNRKNLKSILKNTGPENYSRGFHDFQHLEAAPLSDQNQRSCFQSLHSKKALSKFTFPYSPVKSETSVALVSILKNGKKDPKVQSVPRPTNSSTQQKDQHI